MISKRFILTFAIVLSLSASSAPRLIKRCLENKTYTFSGTSNLACPDFVCSDFLVTVSSVGITNGTWTKVANSETSSHKKAGTVTDCVYPDMGTVSVGFTDPGSMGPDDTATVTILSKATKVIEGVLVTCQQIKTVNINGDTPAAVTVNFDSKSVLVVPSLPTWGFLAMALVVLGGGAFMIYRQRG